MYHAMLRWLAGWRAGAGAGGVQAVAPDAAPPRVAAGEGAADARQDLLQVSEGPLHPAPWQQHSKGAGLRPRGLMGWPMQQAGPLGICACLECGRWCCPVQALPAPTLWWPPASLYCTALHCTARKHPRHLCMFAGMRVSARQAHTSPTRR
jgi:hypothetical protein